MCQPSCLGKTKCSLMEELQNSWMLSDGAPVQRSAALPSAEAVESRGWGKLKVGCKCVGEDKEN